MMMIFIILAAGKGERLKQRTSHLPKALIPLPDGTTFLDRQIGLAINSGLFEKIIIVTGYQAKEIEKVIIRWQKIIPIETIFNPDFALPSPVNSLYLVKNQMMSCDFVLTLCDIIYNEELFNEVKSISSTVPITILASRRTSFFKDDMRLQIDSHNHLMYANKHIEDSKTNGASINIFILTGEQARHTFCQKMEEMMQGAEGTPRFIHHIFNKLVEEQHSVSIRLVPESWWYEVDDLQDYEELLSKLHTFPHDFLH